MQFAKKMILMPQDVARVVNAAKQDKTHLRLGQLDEAMKSTLERNDLSIYEKVQLYNQILQRYLNTGKSMKEPMELRLTPGSTTSAST